MLAQALERFDAEALTYCLMGNHFQLDSDGLHGYRLGRPVASPADRREACTPYARMLEEAFVDRMLDGLPSAQRRTPKTDGVPKRVTWA